MPTLFSAFELEFCIPENDHNFIVSEMNKIVLPNTVQTSKSSSTISWNFFEEFIQDKPNGFYGMELTTPAFRKYPVETMKNLLKMLRGSGCRATDYCGLHLHFSGINPGDLVDFYVRLREHITPRACRARWADPKNLFSKKPYKHYRPINLIDENCWHIEVRMPNGTIGTKAVYNTWYTILKYGYQLSDSQISEMVDVSKPVIVIPAKKKVIRSKQLVF